MLKIRINSTTMQKLQLIIYGLKRRYLWGRKSGNFESCLHSRIIPSADIFDSLVYFSFSPPYKIIMLNWILVPSLSQWHLVLGFYTILDGSSTDMLGHESADGLPTAPALLLCMWVTLLGLSPAQWAYIWSATTLWCYTHIYSTGIS